VDSPDAPGDPQTWHYGVVARWCAEFNVSGPEIAYFQVFVEADGQPALDVACGTDLEPANETDFVVFIAKKPS
jgi:hypothetical protein